MDIYVKPDFEVVENLFDDDVITNSTPGEIIVGGDPLPEDNWDW